MAENTPGSPEPIAAPSPSEPTQGAPAPVQESAGSTTTQQPTNPAPEPTPDVDFDGMDRDAYARLRDELRQTEPAQGEPAPEPTPDPTPTPPEPSTENEPAPEGDDSTSVVPEKGFRPRLDGLPDIEKEAIQLRRKLKEQGKDLSLKDCIAKVEAKYDVTPPATPATTSTQTQAAADPDAIRERIKTMRAELKQAGPEADTVRLADLTIAIDEARDELEAATAAQIEEGKALHTQVHNSRTKARSLYPALTDPNSPLSQRWSEVYDRLEANRDPLITNSHPNIPLVIAQMAAAELGIAPVDPTKARPAATKAAPSVPPKPITPAASPVQPGAGSLRTNAPANPTGQLEARLESVKTTDAYRQLVEELEQTAGR